MRIIINPITAGSLTTVCLYLGLALFGASSPVAAASLYKWTDEDGQIRYSDRLPADQLKKKHQQLNSQGIVLLVFLF